MIGILTEKPSAAKMFANALGGKSGTFNGEEYVIVNSLGHLYGFQQDMVKQVPAELASKYKSWTVSNLPWNVNDFFWRYGAVKGHSAMLNDIKRTLDKCDEIVIGTDLDPTGEGFLLAAEILINKNLTRKKLTRMIFVDESVNSLQKAFKSRVDVPNIYNYPEYKKSIYRSKWDFLSMQFTRISTYYGFCQYPQNIRQGRLKSVMVNAVGEQLQKFNTYKRIPFYSNRFKDEHGNIFINPDEPMFKLRNEVPNQYIDSNIVVEKVIKKSTTPSKLLDLASLTSILVKKGHSADAVLSTYQKMYESRNSQGYGIVSYPRTEDKFVTPEQFDELLPYIDKIADLVGIDKSIITHRLPRKTHVKTGGAHGANRPGLNVPRDIASLDQFGSSARDIYITLARNYLAMLCEDYEYETHYAHLEKYPDFKGSANVPLKQGFKAINYGSLDDDIEVGDVFGDKASPFVYEGFPPKPAYPTMGWLMKWLERYNVGTGATRANTYIQISNKKDKNRLFDTQKDKINLSEVGQKSYFLLVDTNIGNVEITEQVMNNMKEIEKGNLDIDVALNDVARLVSEDLKIMEKNSKILQKEMGLNKMANIQEKEKFEGRWNGKEVKFSREAFGHRFTDDECAELCRGNVVIVKGLSSKAGNKYDGEFTLDHREFTNNEGKTFKYVGIGFSTQFPKAYLGHTFTDDEATMLQAGKEVFIRGYWSSKKNKNFNAKTTYTDGKFNFHFGN